MEVEGLGSDGGGGGGAAAKGGIGNVSVGWVLLLTLRKNGVIGMVSEGVEWAGAVQCLCGGQG